MDYTIALASRGAVNTNFSTAIPHGSVSALMGTPPVTEKDYYIAQFFLYSYGMKTDPIHGSPVSPKRPANYAFETHGPGIITSMSVSIVVMSIITLLRLGVRFFRQGLRVGLDDVFIVPGFVCVLHCPFLTSIHNISQCYTSGWTGFAFGLVAS
jgi:hypothetical protein